MVFGGPSLVGAGPCARPLHGFAAIIDSDMPYIEPDYLELWQALSARRSKGDASSFSYFDNRQRAEAFDSASRRKNRDKDDPLLDFVKSELKAEDTVLDIGAGTGRWSVPIASVVSRVTAVEPAVAMAAVLSEHARDSGVLERIAIISSTWETADVPVHDVVLCFHAIYSSHDFAAFVRKMQTHARRRCYLGIRHFHVDGIMQELSARIHGTRHDSPNFVVAYNALYQMGIYGNVLMEDFRRTWADATLDSAFARAKRHLHVEGDAMYDGLIRETLERRLERAGDSYCWPDQMATALIWWTTGKRKPSFSN